MRVFDVYTFNIADRVKFKDTKKYVDAFLNELGFTYQNVAFMYEGFLTKLDQVLAKYPNLSKYYFAYDSYGDGRVLTSLTPNWSRGEVYAAKEDWDSLFEIASKCPRGLNITGKLVLDQIDWYSEGVKEAAMNCGKDDVEMAQLPLTRVMINSQIVIQREYDDGNKYNGLKVVVEATTADEPRDTTDIIRKLEPYLGVPDESYRVCRGSLEEGWELCEKEVLCGTVLCRKIKDVFPEEGKHRDREWDLEFLPNLADKKKIKAAFKGTGFELGDRKGLLPGMNQVHCRDAGNREYRILFDRTQSSPDYFYWYVYVSGYNFSIESGQNIMYVEAEQEAGAKLSAIAEFCVKLVKDMEQVLEENFGATPKWYTY